MKTSTLLWIGGAAAVGYFLTRKRATSSPTPTADAASDGSDASAADIMAASDASQNGANAITPSVIIVQPDDYYDTYYGGPWGWGPAWGGGGGRRHHGGHGGGHHGGHRGRH